MVSLMVLALGAFPQAPASAHKSTYCGHGKSGIWGLERVYFVDGHRHRYKHVRWDGSVWYSTEHHHKYNHKQFSPLGWLHQHWVKHKRCPKH